MTDPIGDRSMRLWHLWPWRNGQHYDKYWGPRGFCEAGNVTEVLVRAESPIEARQIAFGFAARSDGIDMPQAWLDPEATQVVQVAQDGPLAVISYSLCPDPS